MKRAGAPTPAAFGIAMLPAALVPMGTALVLMAATSLACGGGGRGQSQGAPPSDGSASAGAPTAVGSGPQPASAGPTAPPGSGPAPQASTHPPGSTSAIESTVTATLYFADSEGRLSPEQRELAWEQSPSEQARRVVQALLDGPSGRLSPVIPREASILAAYVSEDGTAFVDMDNAFSRELSRGSEDALLAVESIVDSLAMSVAEIQRVKILVDGEEVRDLGGHLDLSRPIAPTPPSPATPSGPGRSD